MFNIAQYFPITDPTLIFFVVLMMILLSPIIMGRLRIPYIIGMVLAGVLVGEYGLNIKCAETRCFVRTVWKCRLILHYVSCRS